MSIERRYHPIDLQKDIAVGIKLPFVSKSGQLFDLSYSTEEQALSNLKNLLLTRKGERLFEPLFGTDIYRSLFENNTELLRSNITNSISSAVEFWLPYISIIQLEVNQVIVDANKVEEHGVEILLRVAVNNVEANVPITFLLTSSGIEII